ncbi:Non-homologous end joining protein Ku [Streptomyces alboniger]
MPRTIWSGAISFGLVTVPIHVQSATEDHSIRFHQYHQEDMGRVRTRKVCEVEDRDVAQSEIGKGYELTKTQVIPTRGRRHVRGWRPGGRPAGCRRG